MPISSYSNTASGNDGSGKLFPEGMAAQQVNNSARQMQADVRLWYEDAEWINLGYTTTYASGTSFTVASTDVTSVFSVGRRVRAVGSSTGTIYGKIASSSFSTNTTVTVTWDTGSLSSETLTISVALIKGGTSAQSIDITSLDGVGTMAQQDASNATATFANTGLKVLDTNASHALSLVPGSNITADRKLTITTGDADRTLTISADATISGTNTGNESAASTSVAGVVELATQAEVVAASDAARVAALDMLKYHPAIPKVFGSINQTGTQTLRSGSYGISSITDIGGGSTRITFSQAFANTNYVVVFGGGVTSGACLVSEIGTRTTTTIDIQSATPSTGTDLEYATLAIWGTLA